MRALVQRVLSARVQVGERVTGAIGRGLLVLLAAEREDGESQADWTARKVAELRIFSDASGRMNLDVREVRGDALVVPQFTLYGDTRRGRRPDFTRAAKPDQAIPLLDRFCAALTSAGLTVERGVFGAHMKVELLNDGPVTLLVESPKVGLGPRG